MPIRSRLMRTAIAQSRRRNQFDAPGDDGGPDGDHRVTALTPAQRPDGIAGQPAFDDDADIDRKAVAAG